MCHPCSCREALIANDEPANSVGPSSPLEQSLLSIFAQVLSTRSLNLHTDFFRAGGSSLAAMRLVALVRREVWPAMSMEALFTHGCVQALAAHMRSTRGDEDPTKCDGQAGVIQRAELPTPYEAGSDGVGAYLPISFNQEQILLAVNLMQVGRLHMEAASLTNQAYNTAMLLDVYGELDIPALWGAVRLLLSRHAVLRSRFALDASGRPHVVTYTAQAFDELHKAACGLDQPAIDMTKAHPADVDSFLQAKATTPFKLLHGPLLSCVLVRTRECHRLLICVHHAMTDGWSFGVMSSELSEAYRALARGTHVLLPSLPIQYVDYSVWQHQQLSDKAWLATEVDYWRGQLEGAPALLELPADMMRPAQVSGEGAKVAVFLPPDLVRKLSQVRAREGVTLSTLLLTAFYVLLARYSRQDDVVVGGVVGG